MQERNAKNQELKEKYAKTGNGCSGLVVVCEKVEERNAELTKQMSYCRQCDTKIKKENEQMIEKMLNSNVT